MRTKLLFSFAALCLIGLNCSSPPGRPGNKGGEGGSDEGGAGGESSGGKGGSSSGGKGGSSSGGKGGASEGGSGGSSSGGAGGSSAGGSGGEPSGGSGGSSSGGAGGSSGGAGGSSGGAGGSSGGAGGSAPAKDGGATDAPPVSGMGCTGVTAKYCDDFEGGTPAGYKLGANITLDTTKPHSGTKSMHFKPSGTTYMEFTKQFPMNDMHGRLWMYMTKTPTTSSHWNWLVSSNSGNTEWSIGGQYGNFELVCDPPDNGIDSKTPFPKDKWVCMQWQYGYDPATKKSSFYVKIDGAQVDGSPISGPKGSDWVAGAWSNLKIGWELFGSGTPPEFWVDDLVFGEQDYPCE